MRTTLTLILSCVVQLAAAFNFDANSALLYQHTSDTESFFGYSVATYIEAGNPYFIAGAPLHYTRWRGGHRTGRVYRCNPFNNKCRRTDSRCPCVKIPFPDSEYLEKKGIRQGVGHRVPNDRNNQWLGATVAATSINGTGAIAACAPRFIYNPVKPTDQRSGLKLDRDRIWAPVGECMVYTGKGGKYKVVSPCKSVEFTGQGQCQAGFSIDMYGYKSSSGDFKLRFVTGLPGSYVGQGDVYFGSFNNNDLDNQWTFHGATNQIQGRQDKRALDKESYLGYSVKLTKLRQDERMSADSENDVLASRPFWRQNKNLGSVFISDQYMTKVHILNDTFGHIGSYFGYSLTSADLDGNGVGDIIVGAPYHVTTEQRSRGQNVDIGRVYVYYGQFRDERYQLGAHKPTVLQGTTSGGRFGTSVAVLGDIDDDGLQDIAVGCPFCGKHGRGQVFIYLSKRGSAINSEPAQIIDAEEMRTAFSITGTESGRPEEPAPPVVSFGWSLDAGYDLDANGYPDLVVGSYRSAHVATIRTRPVIRLVIRNQDLKVPRVVKAVGCQQLPENCKFSLKFKWTVTRKFHPDLEKTLTTDPIEFLANFDFDSLLTEKRVSYRGRFAHQKMIQVYDWTRNGSIMSASGNVEITNLDVQERGVDTDIVTPIRVFLKLEPRWEQTGLRPTWDNRKPGLKPILHPGSRQEISFPDVDIFKKECGQDNVCHPDLQLNFLDPKLSQQGTLWYGEQKRPREIVARITNQGEPAFGANFSMLLPPGVEWWQGVNVKLSSLLENAEEAAMLRQVFCSQKRIKHSITNETGWIQVSCDLLNPLPNLGMGEYIMLAFNITANKVLEETGSGAFKLKATVASQNIERPDKGHNNQGTLHFGIKVNTILRLTTLTKRTGFVDRRKGAKTPSRNDPVELNRIGTHFTHTYQLVNSGMSPADVVGINITVPLLSEYGDQLVYLLEKVAVFQQGTQQEAVTLLPRILNMKNEVRGSCRLDQGIINPLKLSVYISEQNGKKFMENRAENLGDLEPTDRVQLLRERRSTRTESPGMGVEADSSLSRPVLPSMRTRVRDQVRCGKPSNLFGRLQCGLITCSVKDLQKGEIVKVVLDGVLWAHTAFNYRATDLHLFTEAVAFMNQVPYNLPVEGDSVESEVLPLGQFFVFTGVKMRVLSNTPIWVIILAVILGVLLLTLIIVGLWKCGFFKRKRWQKKATEL